MKKYLFCLSLLLCGLVHADELSNANALYAKKAYPQAVQAYIRLANAGNAEAQLKLAEIYAGADAGPADPAKSDAWLRKAAAKGNKSAVAMLERSTQREARRADIDYWMAKYDGSDLKAGEYRCPAPRFPAISKLDDEIDTVSKRLSTWEACYNKYVVNLNAAKPLTQRIPKDVAELMTKDEMARATDYLAEVHSSLAQEAKVTAKLVLADFAVWRDATSAYVQEHNRIVTDAKAKAKND